MNDSHIPGETPDEDPIRPADAFTVPEGDVVDDAAPSISDDGLLVASDAEPQRRRRGLRVLAFSAAAVALLGVGGVGGALAATNFTSTSTSSAQQVAPGQSGNGGTQSGEGFSGGFGGSQSGNGFSGGFSGGSGSSGSTTSQQRETATASEQKGIVTIVTTLGYQSASAAGTGMVLTSSGEILTNNHVVEGATSIKVTVESTGRTYTAKVVGTDATHDVAVLQLAGASGLTTAPMATTAAKTGDSVVAVGNAGGTGTLTRAAGSVTGTGKSITTSAEEGTASEHLSGLIETDANIESGDSGGPLLNSSGQVVGIDTAAGTSQAGTDGYAIPISTALDIAAQIIAGDDTADITIGYPAFLGVEVGSTTTGTTGAPIAGVVTGTPAASAGLEEGDTITAVNGSSIASASALTTKLHSYQPGDSVKITYSDTDGASHTVTVTLIAGPAD